MDEEIVADNQFDFDDINFKLVAAPFNNFRISASLFRSQNEFNYISEQIFDRFETRDIVDYNSTAFQIKASLQESEKHQTEFSLASSESQNSFDYTLQNTDEDEVINNTSIFNAIEDDFIRLVHHFKIDEHWLLDFGYNYNKKSVSFILDEVIDDEEDFFESTTTQEEFNNLFGAFEMMSDKWRVNGGLKYTSYVNSEQRFWSPRMNIQYRINDHFKLDVSASRMYQFINQLEDVGDFDLNLNGNIWILRESDEDSFIESQKLSLGLIMNTENWLIDFSLYRNMSSGLSLLRTTSGIEADPFVVGEADVQGIDALVQAQWGGFYSQLNYSLSKHNYDFPTVFDATFLSPNDQTHRLNWLNRLSIGRFQFSLAGQYKTGLPTTEVTGFDLINPAEEEYELEFGPINALRLDDYLRFDVGVGYSLVSTTTKIQCSLSVLNMFNRTNVLDNFSFIDENEEGVFELFSIQRQLLGRTPLFMIRVYW